MHHWPQVNPDHVTVNVETASWQNKLNSRIASHFRDAPTFWQPDREILWNDCSNVVQMFVHTRWQGEGLGTSRKSKLRYIETVWACCAASMSLSTRLLCHEFVLDCWNMLKLETCWIQGRTVCHIACVHHESWRSCGWWNWRYSIPFLLFT